MFLKVVISIGTPDTYKYFARNHEFECLSPIIPDRVRLAKSVSCALKNVWGYWLFIDTLAAPSASTDTVRI